MPASLRKRFPLLANRYFALRKGLSNGILEQLMKRKAAPEGLLVRGAVPPLSHRIESEER